MSSATQVLRGALRGARAVGKQRKLSLLVACLAISWHNKSLERRRMPYKNVVFTFHVVYFALRKTLSTLLLSPFGLTAHPYWNPLDEIFVRTVAFAARTGHVTAPRHFINILEFLHRCAARLFGHCHVEDVDLGLGNPQGDALWIARDKAHRPADGPVVFYVHGGGYCVGTAGMWIPAMVRWLEEMEKDLGAPSGMLSIEYPLAPETRYPDNLHFVCDAFDALVAQHKVDPARIIIAGDSAGGALALQVARHAATAYGGGVSPVSGMVLISPWVNHSCEADSHERHLWTDFIAGHDVIGDYSRAYSDHAEHPHVSPIVEAGDLPFMPPIFVTVGSREVFHNDIEIFVDEAAKAGRHVEKFEGADCPHIFPMLYPVFRAKADHALREAASFCVRRLQAASDMGVPKANAAAHAAARDRAAPLVR